MTFVKWIFAESEVIAYLIVDIKVVGINRIKIETKTSSSAYLITGLNLLNEHNLVAYISEHLIRALE